MKFKTFLIRQIFLMLAIFSLALCVPVTASAKGHHAAQHRNQHYSGHQVHYKKGHRNHYYGRRRVR